MNYAKVMVFVFTDSQHNLLYRRSTLLWQWCLCMCLSHDCTASKRYKLYEGRSKSFEPQYIRQKNCYCLYISKTHLFVYSCGHVGDV